MRMRLRGIAIYLGAFAVAVILFLFFPQIDLATSRIFYVFGRGFAAADWPPVVILFRMVPWITWFILVLVGIAAIWLFLFGRPLCRLDRKAIVFLIGSLALGPGILANTILKDHWGRARPGQIEAFGGTRQFTPAPLRATECQSNCSFVSGHAALGYSLVAFAFLLPAGVLRRAVTAAALVIGSVVGIGRIAQGAHFLSDVVYAGFAVIGTTSLLYWWIVERDGLTAPLLIRIYRALHHGAAVVWVLGRRALAARDTRLVLLITVAGALIGISLDLVDRPLALFFHSRDPDLRALFDVTGRLGLTYGYLIVFGFAFVALHWGGSLPRLAPVARPMRSFSAIPAFIFLSIAVSGLVVDLLKFICGRLRPKLLFSTGAYDFAWLGLRPDHWSFPSGHSATIVALMTALWWLWPRHLLFYLLVALIVSFSRVAVGAHYLSDVLAGALIAVLTTQSVASIFARCGFDLAAARRGLGSTHEAPPWPCRRFGRAGSERELSTTEIRRVASVDGGGCSIGPKAARGSRIGSISWPCASKPSTTPAAETPSTRP
jgi:lipid A 4'-phosphatase